MRLRSVAAVALLALFGCAEPDGDAAEVDDFARGAARGYELALDDLKDCALEDGGVDAFRECVASRARGVASRFRLSESDAERSQRGQEASGKAFLIWSGLLLRIGP